MTGTVEPAFRGLFAAYEWLRDGASPFDTMIACRLQSPNWWRTAHNALAAARALLDASAGQPSRGADDGQVGGTIDDQVWRLVAAIRWTFEAAVALRLPYDALQPIEAWALGWRGIRSPLVTTSGGNAMIAACREVLAADGASCRREGIAARRLAAALDHAERTLAVCYTDREKPSCA